MVVHDFDAVRAIHFPHEANTPLVIDANAVLALAIAFQRLQLITGRNVQTGEFGCCMELQQLAPATRSMFLKRATAWALNSFSVSRDANERIMRDTDLRDGICQDRTRLQAKSAI